MKSCFRILTSALLVVLPFAERAYAEGLNDRVKEELRRTVLSSLSWPEEKVKISFRNLGQMDYEQDSKIRVFLLCQEQPRGMVPVRLEIYDQEKPPKSMIFSIEVKIYDEVVVSAKKLGRNEEVTPDELSVEYREVTNFTDKYFVSKEQMEGKRAKNTISKGRILGSALVEDVPLVKYGDKVRIVAKIGGIEVYTFGTANQDGGLGEEIKIKNMDSRKVISARVIDSRTVDIDLNRNF